MGLRTLDLFCGGGGSSYGARLAGAEIVCGVDAWPLAIDTFKSNFQSARVFNRRLEDIDPRELHRSIGPIDLILASPECTNHTCAKGSALRSEESRRTAFQVTRFAKEFQPRWLIVENVVQMRRWYRYQQFCRELSALGYRPQELVLDAQQFNTPQTRRRLFLVCELGVTNLALQVAQSEARRNVADILDPSGTWPMSPLFTSKRALDTVVRYLTGLEQVGPQEQFLLVYYGSDGCGGWQSLERPLRTVTTVDRFALVDQAGSEPLIRMLQVPELKRAMGFGDDYRLPVGTRRDRIKLLGNAVCPSQMRAVIEALQRGTGAAVAAA